MGHSVNVFNLIVLLGIVQGTIVAIVLYFIKPYQKYKVLLIALLITMALLSVKILLHTLELWPQQYWRFFPFAIDTLIQPLFYGYVCSLTSKDFSIKKNWFHFLLPSLFFLHGMVVYFVSVGEPSEWQKDLIAQKWLYNPIKLIEDILAILSGVFYWALAYLRVKKYRQWLFENQSSLRYQELSWLRNLLLGTAALIVLLTIDSVSSNILSLRKNNFIYTQIFYTYLTFLIYNLSFQGLRITYSTPAFIDPVKAIIEKTKNEEETVSPLIYTAIIKALEEDKLFLNPELSLKDLATFVNVPMSQVSATLNGAFKQNFRNLINQYRVEEVKQKLTEQNLEHLTLAGIAYECGFNSEASFYRVFRQVTGMSPKSYLKTINTSTI